MLTITQINSSDVGGGAESVALDIFRTIRARGHSMWLVVGRKRTNGSDIFVIPHDQVCKGWSRFWWGVYARLQLLDDHTWRVRWLNNLVTNLAEPQTLLDSHRGIENFHYPGVWGLLNLVPHKPDIIHCHNLHGEYFDLRILPWLSQQVPVILTLHDAWLLSGHCAHSFDCERWQTGCGQCPDLSIYPAISRDATAYNWQRKRDIFAQSQFYISTPSQWLMQRVNRSMLAPAAIETRVIPNGVDLSVFHPVDQQAARSALGIPTDIKILLFAANTVRQNIWKDYRTMQAAVTQVAEHFKGQKIRFIGLGDKAPSGRIGQAEVEFVPFQKDPKIVASYYQAADIYVHAARAEVWGRTITEALACGTPVVATAVGGIPEQIKSLSMINDELKSYHISEANGILVAPQDAPGMAKAIIQLLSDERLRKQLGENAANDARHRFSLDLQVEAYLDWYQEIVECWNKAKSNTLALGC